MFKEEKKRLTNGKRGCLCNFKRTLMMMRRRSVFTWNFKEIVSNFGIQKAQAWWQ
jgi:hypothetical protein